MKVVTNITNKTEALLDDYFNAKAVDWPRTRSTSYVIMPNAAGVLELHVLRDPAFDAHYPQDIRLEATGSSDQLSLIMPMAEAQIKEMMQRERRGVICDLQIQALSEINTTSIVFQQGGKDHETHIRPDDTVFKFYVSDAEGNFKIYLLELCSKLSVPAADKIAILENGKIAIKDNEFYGVNEEMLQQYIEQSSPKVLLDWLDKVGISGAGYVGGFGDWLELEKCVDRGSLFGINLSVVKIQDGIAQKTVITEINPRLCSLKDKVIKTADSLMVLTKALSLALYAKASEKIWPEMEDAAPAPLSAEALDAGWEMIGADGFSDEAPLEDAAAPTPQ